MDGRFRRNPLPETAHHKGHGGSQRKNDAEHLCWLTFVTLMFIDVLLQGADPALLLTQH
jgi:hypothetical protein